jgi:hypothetical protein
MYVKRILIGQIIKLFTEEPDYRDDRMETVKAIVEKYYRKEYGKDIVATCKLVFDIDRGFRYIQQHVPQLRGKDWLIRQKISGEMSQEEYEKKSGIEKDIKFICKQFQIEFK